MVNVVPETLWESAKSMEGAVTPHLENARDALRSGRELTDDCFTATTLTLATAHAIAAEFVDQELDATFGDLTDLCDTLRETATSWSDTEEQNTLHRD